jgi:hypothetical protein
LRSGKRQVVWAKQPSSTSPPSPYRTEAQGTERPTGGGGRGAGDPVHDDGREVGETKRSSRATDFAPYLGWGRTVEGDRRPAVGLLVVVAGAALVVAMEGSGRRGK